ncbi:DUF423 domain-containing protein [Xylanibacillus composti]|uniref:Membrane protein n=1 Tax=Xylanibacillus composti TaxID=1572762 RepID=A0A8J4H2Y3_9BACL|nr:DUF423 domain-containing protein [Xylanibacillus composti]MDT9724748.1 DUF423 domain-containing protein [Xylanibacillus composti]GIQ69899.1 membrane protein [Xylanibacillus composti]
MAAKLMFWASMLAMLAVALGAFGAHALEDRVSPERMGTYETAVQYQFYHAIALFLTGLAARGQKPSSPLVWAGRLFVAGIALFSGSLYILVATGVTWLGAITPLGGVSFILGWILLGLSVKKSEL